MATLDIVECMYLAGYPDNYILDASRVHPALQETHAKFLELIERPRGLLKEYPILRQMLAHNLGFLGERDLVYAHNVHGGVKVIVDMMHVESGEFQVETPIANRNIRDWSLVNGHATLEAIDVHFLAGLVAGMLESGMGSLDEIDMLSLHLTMQQISEESALHPNLNPYDEDSIKKVVHPSSGKNHANYPLGANKAPRKWDIPTMAQFYLATSRPRQKGLRETFRDRKLPSAVAQAINLHKPQLPKRYANPNRENKYKALYEVIYKGE